jgi:hypothetical protein
MARRRHGRKGPASAREKELREVIEEKDVEALLWWIVEDHAGALLDKDKTALGGYPRAALDHLARFHLRRIMGANDAGRPSTEDAVAELENVLRLVK